MRKIMPFTGLCAAAVLMSGCVSAPQAVDVSWNNQFSPQTFRFYKAAPLGVFVNGKVDANASNILETELYNQSSSYPEYKYLYPQSAITQSYGAAMTTRLQTIASQNDKFRSNTTNFLSTTSAPFEYLVWATVVSDQTSQDMQSDYLACPQFNSLPDQCNPWDTVFQSARQIDLTASVYDIQKRTVIWKANVSVFVQNSSEFLPYPIYPTVDEALHYAFKSLATKLYTGQALPQRLDYPVDSLDDRNLPKATPSAPRTTPPPVPVAKAPAVPKVPN